MFQEFLLERGKYSQRFFSAAMQNNTNHFKDLQQHQMFIFLFVMEFYQIFFKLKMFH